LIKRQVEKASSCKGKLM